MASPLNVRPKVPCECEHSRLRVRGASAKMLLKSPLRTTCSSLSQSSPRIEPLHCGPSNAYPNRKRRQLMAQGRIPSATQRFFLLSEELLPCLRAAGMPHHGRVGMWRGGFRLNRSVSASFVWRCLSGAAVTPFPHSAHRTRTGGSPTSGSRTRPHAFAHGSSCPSRHRRTSPKCP